MPSPPSHPHAEPGRALHHRVDYFEDLYRRDPDPWGFDREWYERRKYDLTLAALPRRRYRRALEPGCANGALTERLAARCDSLVAFDIVPAAATRARTRIAVGADCDLEIGVGTFPTTWPSGTGDLVVWSEVAYYLTPEGRCAAASGLRSWLEPGGHLVAVHYTGETDYPMTGTAVATWIDSLDGLDRVVSIVDPGFELVVWERASGEDIAGPARVPCAQVDP
ncbi:MAG: SAM-dependent methyltransferase [Acidimicrobiales bacterium]